MCNLSKILKIASLLLLYFLSAADGIYAQYSDHRGYNTDSLERELRKNKSLNAEQTARIYKALMWGYSEYDIQRSMMYAHKLAEVSRRENYTLALTNSLRVIGMQHYGMCQYDSAMHYLSQALEASALMIGDDRYDLSDAEDEQAMIYGTMGNVYNMQGMNTLAIEHYEKVQRICEKYHWNESLATVALNISELYFGIGNYKMAEEYVNTLDSLAQLTGDSLFIAKVHIEKGTLCRDAHNDLEQAERHADAALAYFIDRTEEGSWKLTSLHLKASVLLSTGKLKEAEEIIGSELRLAEEMSSPYDIASALAQQAQLFAQQGKYSKVIESAERALSYNDMEPQNTLGIYKLLGEAYTKLGKADKAMEQYSKALELQASWSNENHQSALAEQKVRYETEQKEIQIALLQQEKQLMMWLAVSGGALTLLIILLLFNLNRLHRRQKRILATQVALKSETSERRRIAQDLHDGLGGILSLAKIQLEAGNQTEAMKAITGASVEMRRVAHHIMPEALMKLGLVTALTDFIAAVPNASFHCHGKAVALEPSVEVLIYRAVYELVNNSMKHSGASSIEVQIIYHPDRITISVIDNGKGFGNDTKWGFGLNNISSRIEVYGGKMTAEPNLNPGAEINIEIPITNKI